MSDFGEKRRVDTGRLERLKKAVKVGDEIYCMHVVKSPAAVQCLEEKKVRVRIVGKYPHLVEVAGKNPYYQRRTVTYAEMLMNENSYMLRGNRKLMRAAGL